MKPLTFYKVKISNRYFNAVGRTPEQQRRDAEKLAARYGGKVVRIESR